VNIANEQNAQESPDKLAIIEQARWVSLISTG
jgi:hypothetical protein